MRLRRQRNVSATKCRRELHPKNSTTRNGRSAYSRPCAPGLQREYAAAGKAAWFDELKVVLWGGRGEVSYAEIARQLDSTEGAVKVAVYRLRQRFKEALHAEIAHTVLDPADVDDELRHLLAAVSV